MREPLVDRAERERLADWVEDARARTFAVVDDLTDAQMTVPRLAIVNPPLWELGHVAWFQERWVLRHAAKHAPLLAQGDAIYDSTAVAHDTRWDLPLLRREPVLAYLEQVRDRVLDRLESRSLTEREAYFIRLSVFHEDMHEEAFTYTRQTLGYPAPRVPTDDTDDAPEADDAPDAPFAPLGDVHVPGGTFLLGASPSEPFVFDNEKWAHPVTIEPFSIARAAVTQGEFAAFVDDGGYTRRELWTDEGWTWRVRAHAERPAYWSRERGGWTRRWFDRVVALEPALPVLHVNAFEAEAYCRWAGRRLPTEAEWEVAATGESDAGGRALSTVRRPHPWGDAAPSPAHAHLDGRAAGCLDVRALEAGDGAFGCRQLWGNVWEWTSTPFEAYPGFVADPYEQYSAPWFGTHRVLRGGCFATRARLLRNTWRNFFTPDRRDVFAGLRTCARR